MQRLNSQIKIAARPQSVWKVLRRFNEYDDWNTQLSFLEGKAYEGARLKVIIKPLYYRVTQSKLTVSYLNEPGRMVLTNIGILPFGLLTLDCLFTLSENEDGSTTLHLHQHYKGILAVLIKQPSRFREARKSCIKMNAEIKRRAEQLYLLKKTELATVSV